MSEGAFRRLDQSVRVQSQNRKFFLLIGLFLLGAVLVGVLTRRDQSAAEQWKEEMRAQGEKFTVAELFPAGLPPATNRLGELVRLGQDLSSQAYAVAASNISVTSATASWNPAERAPLRTPQRAVLTGRRLPRPPSGNRWPQPAAVPSLSGSRSR